jgi:SAM-dependent methyltransferase
VGRTAAVAPVEDDTGAVRMNRLGRAVLNSPARALAQRRWVVPTMARLGARLDGVRVLEVGCGRGAGSALIVDRLGAAHVDAIDLDPVMVRLAARRAASTVHVAVGDMVSSGSPTSAYDAVVDMGAIHLEPRWPEALTEIRRVLRPGGRFCFEEIVRPRRQSLSTVAIGRRPPGDFSAGRFLAELDALGFVLVGFEWTGWPWLTGLVGDVVGVARLPEHPPDRTPDAPEPGR